MARKKITRFVYNVKTGIAHGATDTIMQYLHKKNMKELRLMPEGWFPGDAVEIDSGADNEVSPKVLDAIAASIAKSMPGADEQTIRQAIADATGQQIAAPADDIVQAFDPNALQEVVAEISGMNPNDKAEFTNSGKPDAKVLTQRLGRTVSAAERDQAFELFNAPVVD